MRLQIVRHFPGEEPLMPVIKPRTRGKQVVRHITRLDRENNETLYAYAQFLGEPPEYVLNQLVESVLGKDKEFLAWREQHPDSFVPAPVRRLKKGKRGASASDRPHQIAPARDAVSAPAAG
jgi:hypothetical protein